MARRLVEMGATRLLELGRGPSLGRVLTMGEVGQTGIDLNGPVAAIFKFVNTMEDPVALQDDGDIDEQQRAIASKLRSISRHQRVALVNPRMAGLGNVDWDAEARKLCATLNGVGLGKSLKSKFKKVVRKVTAPIKKINKKIIKIVKSPAFLSVAGLAANLIPGVGQIASAALLTAAAIRQKKEQGKAMDKEEKRAIQQAEADLTNQVNSFYAEYKDNFEALGYTQPVWDGFNLEQKVQVAEDLAANRLQPYNGKPPTPPILEEKKEEVANAAAMSQAMQQAYGSALPGQGLDTSSLPPDVKQAADEKTPSIVEQMKAVGLDNFMAAAMKAVGQAGALNAFVTGAGASGAIPGQWDAVFGKAPSDALEAGKQDLINSAALDGDAELAEEAIDRGLSSDTMLYVAVGLGAAAVGIGLVMALRSR